MSYLHRFARWVIGLCYAAKAWNDARKRYNEIEDAVDEMTVRQEFKPCPECIGYINGIHQPGCPWLITHNQLVNNDRTPAIEPGKE